MQAPFLTFLLLGRPDYIIENPGIVADVPKIAVIRNLLLIFERKALVFQPLTHDQGPERGDSAESCECFYDLLVFNRTGQPRNNPATRNSIVSVGKTLASTGMPPASAGTAMVNLS